MLKQLAPPVNIVSPFSGRVTSPLGAALTNVTYDKWPISVPNMKVQPTQGYSAEHFYKANKTGDLSSDIKIMCTIIQAKFKQYPQLAMQITDNGGSKWLTICSHIVYNRSRWEGIGIQSAFIKVLITAYEYHLMSN